MGFVLQTLSAHLAIVTGSHLAELCFAEYPGPVSFFLFLSGMLSVIAFDVAEVIGTAFALQMLFGFPLPLGMVISALDTALILFLQRRGLKGVELVVESLLGVLAGCMLLNFALSHPNVQLMVQGTFAPDLTYKPRESLLLSVGILGSVVMGHNLFLHSGIIKMRREEQGDVFVNDADLISAGLSPHSGLGRHFVTEHSWRSSCDYATLEAAAVLVGSFIINGAVLSVAAAQFYPHRAEAAFRDIGLQDASVLLEQVLGTRAASTAWAIALLASGHAATVTGTLASQLIFEGFWSIPPASSYMSLLSRGIAIVPALVAGLTAGARGADRLIILCQIVVSFELPFAVVPLLKFSDHPVVAATMPGPFFRRAGWVSFVFALMANVWTVAESLRGFGVFGGGPVAFSYTKMIASVTIGAAYAGTVLYLLLHPVRLLPWFSTADDKARRPLLENTC